MSSVSKQALWQKLSPEMKQELGLILDLLARVRRRAAVLSLLELGLLTLTVGSSLTLLAAALGGLGWTHGILPPTFALVALAIPIVWAARVLWPRFARVNAEKKAAEWVDSTVPEMRNLTLSALELAPHLSSPSASETAAAPPESSVAGAGSFSPDLIRATVSQAAERMQDIHVASLLPKAPLTPWTVSSLVTASVLLAFVVLTPGVISANLTRFLASPSLLTPQTAHQNQGPTDGPALGDITLALTYPAYLEREPEVLENSNGEIRAPRGTEVKVTARAIFKPVQVSLSVEGMEPIAATLDEAGRFTATFVIDKKGTWRASMLEQLGQEPVLSGSYPIEIEEDGAPVVEILNLEPVTEVSLTEPVSIRFRVQDDHGLDRIELVVEGPNKTQRTVLRELAAQTERDEGTFEWYPAEAGIPKGGAVELWLEARDDDTVSGPKVGKSIRYRMTLASDELKREKNIKGKEDLKEALIALLGDELVIHDEPLRSKTPQSYSQELLQARQHMLKVVNGFATVRGLMEEDSNEEVVVYKAVIAMEKELMEGWERVQEGLSDLSGMAPSSRVRITASDLRNRRADWIALLENAVLSMESFTNMARMESILAKGQDLKQAGQELRDLIEQAKKDGKQPDLKAMMEKLQQMQQQLAKMANEMSKLDRSTAEWYQNPAGETQEVKDSLSALQKALEEGKTEDAAKLLEEYLKDTEKLMESLEEMQKQEFNNDRDTTSKDMASVIDGLKEVEEQQKRLTSDTKAISEQITAKNDLTQKQKDDFTKQALNHLDEMRKAANSSEQAMREANGGELPSDTERRLREARDRMNTLEAALKVEDLNRSLNGALDTARNFRSLDTDASRLERKGAPNVQAARDANQAGRKASEALAKDLQQLAERMDRAQEQGMAQGQGLAGRQQSLQQKGEGLGQKLGEYAKDSPVIPGQWGERLKRATQTMQGASGKLENGELAGGMAQQQAALQEISELRKEMEKTQQEMQQQARGPGESQGESPPGKGQGPSKETIASGQPKDTTQSKSSKENWGRAGVKSDSVDISKDYKAPEEYRREVMEGMKGDAPTRYKRLNRDYYEKLVR